MKTSNPFQVRTIMPDEHGLGNQLGILDERRQELQTATDSLFDSLPEGRHLWADTFEKATVDCHNINEVAFVVTMVTREIMEKTSGKPTTRQFSFLLRRFAQELGASPAQAMKALLKVVEKDISDEEG